MPGSRFLKLRNGRVSTRYFRGEGIFESLLGKLTRVEARLERLQGCGHDAACGFNNYGDKFLTDNGGDRCHNQFVKVGGKWESHMDSGFGSIRDDFWTWSGVFFGHPGMRPGGSVIVVSGGGGGINSVFGSPFFNPASK